MPLRLPLRLPWRQVIGWRTPLPVNPLVLGPYAKSTEPFVAQAREPTRAARRGVSVPDFRRSAWGQKAGTFSW